MTTTVDRSIITPDLVQRFAGYYATHLTWGALHIVCDDGNIDNGFVDYCIEYAVETGDVEGEQLARILRTMTKSQRGRIARRAQRLVHL